MFNKTLKGTGGYFIPIFLISFVKGTSYLPVKEVRTSLAALFHSLRRYSKIFLATRRGGYKSSNPFPARATVIFTAIVKPFSINFNIINQREYHSFYISDFLHINKAQL